MIVLWCIGIGLLAGAAGGLFGIGGGVIIVPLLVLTLSFSQHKAQGTSLVALLAPVGILSVLNYYKANNADLVKGAWIALGFFGGAYLGSKIALSLDELTMRRVFAVFLVVLGIYLFFFKKS